MPGSRVQPPPPESLPSTTRLVMLSAIAIVAVALVVVTIVLPAERAVDPTGVGRMLGLTQMGMVKIELAMDAADHEAETEFARATDSTAVVAPGADTLGIGAADTIRVSIAPGETVEVRLIMKQSARVAYAWMTNGPAIRSELFGDSLRSSLRERHRYAAPAAGGRASGELTARFDGWHGWRMHNAGPAAVDVELRTLGRYLGGRQGVVDPE